MENHRPPNQGLRTKLALHFEQFALACVLFPAAIVILATIVFALGGRMGAWILPMAALIAVFGLRAFSGSGRDTALVAAFAALTHVAAYGVAKLFYDGSWDGLAYHQEAILRLAAGWKPFFESVAAYRETHEMIRNEIRIDHFPKASWIAGAAVFLNCGQIETGKLFNFTFMAAAGSLVAAALLRLTTLRIPALAAVALLAACNPVAVYQCTTFYVDGMMASLLTLAVTALILYLVAPRWPSLVLALLASCLMINLKFTGVIYAAVILFAGVLTVWYRHGFRSATRLAGLAAITGIIGVLVIGYAPYVRNQREKGNAVYPMRGENLPDFAPVRPPNLVNRDRFTNFVIANFSRSEATGRPPQPTRLKFPFWIYESERGGWVWIASPEAGGLGPLYGALLLLAGVGIVALISDTSTRSIGQVVLLIAGFLAISVFVHDEGWKARFAPQAWLFPLVVAVACLLARKRSRIWWLGCALVAVATVNVLSVGTYFMWYQWKFARDTRRCLREVSALRQPVFIHVGSLQSLRQRFRESGIDVKILANSPPAEIAITRHAIPSPGPHTFWARIDDVNTSGWTDLPVGEDQ